jgi:hypothetical protein
MTRQQRCKPTAAQDLAFYVCLPTSFGRRAAVLSKTTNANRAPSHCTDVKLARLTPSAGLALTTVTLLKTIKSALKLHLVVQPIAAVMKMNSLSADAALIPHGHDPNL